MKTWTKEIAVENREEGIWKKESASGVKGRECGLKMKTTLVSVSTDARQELER
jgi:hypothetical protein